MAKIREAEPEPEPETEIEESEDGSTEEEGSEDETPQPKTRSLNSHSQKLPNSSSSSSTEEEDDVEESDSDSDVPVKKSDPGIKSTADDLPKPTAAPSAAKKPRSMTSPVKPGSKRAAEKEIVAKVAKKSNKKAGSSVEGENNSAAKVPSASGDDPKKQLFQRLWSEGDEIVILKGMIDFAAKNKGEPIADFVAADYEAFLDFIKKSLHIEVTKTQLQDKVRRLKKKFLDNANKEKKTGKKKTFSKPHDQMVHELSDQIWGNSSVNNGIVTVEKVSQTPKAGRSVVRKSRVLTALPLTPNLNEVGDQEMKDVEVEDHAEVLKIGSGSRGLTRSNVEEWILNAGAKMVEQKKREEMEEKWKKIQKQEVEVFLKRTELMCEQTKLVLEAMRKSEN